MLILITLYNFETYEREGVNYEPWFSRVDRSQLLDEGYAHPRKSFG